MSESNFGPDGAECLFKKAGTEARADKVQIGPKRAPHYVRWFLPCQYANLCKLVGGVLNAVFKTPAGGRAFELPEPRQLWVPFDPYAECPIISRSLRNAGTATPNPL